MDGSRPRLLLVTPDFPPEHGGIQVLAHRLARFIEGFQTQIVTLDCAGAERFDATSGLATRRVRATERLGAGRNVLLDALALGEALRFRPRATLSMHIVVSPAAAAIRCALGARTVQYFYAKEIGGRPRLAAFAAHRAHASIAISSYTAGLLSAIGVPGGSIRVIPAGVDLPSDRSPLRSESPTFLTISRLQDRYKGHDVLIEALPSVRAQVPDVQWVVIGDGPLRPELEARARAGGVSDHVRFLGALPDEERDRWLRRADLLAMPSRLPGDGRAGEGFGIVYLEAGAHRKPVVAGNVAGALDAVIDGETGLLADPTDHLAVADAIVRLLLDRRLARRLGEAGAARAAELAWPRIAKRVEAVLLEQLAHPGQQLAHPDRAGARPGGG